MKIKPGCDAKQLIILIRSGTFKVKVKVAQLCLTLCDLMDYMVHGSLQARILEWVAFPFSRGSSQPRDWTQVSHIAGGFFTSWATREAQYRTKLGNKKALLSVWDKARIHTHVIKACAFFSLCHSRRCKLFANHSCIRQHPGTLFWKWWWREDHKINWRLRYVL